MNTTCAVLPSWARRWTRTTRRPSTTWCAPRAGSRQPRRVAVGGARWPVRPRGASVVSLWLDAPSTCAVETEFEADAVTTLAFATGSLAVPDDVDDPAALLGLDVMGALPIDYVDGPRGPDPARTKPLGVVFDIGRRARRGAPRAVQHGAERQTLALVNACDTILHDADVESREGAGSRAAARRAAVRGLPDSSRRGCTRPRCRSSWRTWRTRTGTPCSPTPTGRRGRAVRPAAAHVHRSRSGGPDGLRPVGRRCPVHEGAPAQRNHVNGLVRCLGTEGRPHHFTTSDLALLRPVAAQLSRTGGPGSTGGRSRRRTSRGAGWPQG